MWAPLLHDLYNPRWLFLISRWFRFEKHFFSNCKKETNSVYYVIIRQARKLPHLVRVFALVNMRRGVSMPLLLAESEPPLSWVTLCSLVPPLLLMLSPAPASISSDIGRSSHFPFTPLFLFSGYQYQTKVFSLITSIAVVVIILLYCHND